MNLGENVGKLTMELALVCISEFYGYHVRSRSRVSEIFLKVQYLV